MDKQFTHFEGPLCIEDGSEDEDELPLVNEGAEELEIDQNVTTIDLKFFASGIEFSLPQFEWGVLQYFHLTSTWLISFLKLDLSLN